MTHVTAGRSTFEGTDVIMPPAAPHILVVEDSRTQATLLAYQLKTRGYRVTVSPDGAAALLAAHRLQPDLIVSDVHMPRMDGYQLCTELKRDAKLSTIPVILLTSPTDDPAQQARAAEARAERQLPKPYDSDALAACIAQLLP